MKPTSCNLPTSFVFARSRSWANTRFFCRTGGKEGDTFSLCTMTDGSILGMSSWFQANTSWFSLRKATITRWTVGLARMPMVHLVIVLEPLYKFRPRLLFLYAHGLYMVVHLRHRNIAFARSYLISSQFPYSILSREFNHQVVGWSYGLPWVKG